MNADLPARLAGVEPVLLEGARWWPIAEICEALRIPWDRRCYAYSLVPPASKRPLVVHGRRMRMIDRRRICVIDRAGVERLVIRYSRGVARGELMAALDRGPPRGGSA